MNKKIERLKNIIQSLIIPINQSEDSDIQDFFIALHNAFVHGKIVPEISEEQLSSIFYHLDKLVKISQEI